MLNLPTIKAFQTPPLVSKDAINNITLQHLDQYHKITFPKSHRTSIEIPFRHSVSCYPPSYVRPICADHVVKKSNKFRSIFQN